MGLSEEHKAKLAAGRAAAKERREANQAPKRKIEDAPKIYPETALREQGTIEQKTVQVEVSVLEKLLAEVEELKKQKNPEMTPEAALHYTAAVQGFNTNVGQNGVQGRIFKYPVDKGFYPDPTVRLYDEPRLQRFGLKDNFLFDWDVEGVEYEKYGVTYAEPRFTVRLFRRIFESDGITPTGQMALVNRNILHEDEIVARAAADKLGLTESFSSFQEMMNEMRYHRIRQWLFELFTPVDVHQHNRQARQMVVDGKVVEMYDTETLIDKGSAESKSSTIQSDVRI